MEPYYKRIEKPYFGEINENDCVDVVGYNGRNQRLSTISHLSPQPGPSSSSAAAAASSSRHHAAAAAVAAAAALCLSPQHPLNAAAAAAAAAAAGQPLYHQPDLYRRWDDISSLFDISITHFR